MKFKILFRQVILLWIIHKQVRIWVEFNKLVFGGIMHSLFLMGHEREAGGGGGGGGIIQAALTISWNISIVT